MNLSSQRLSSHLVRSTHSKSAYQKQKTNLQQRYDDRVFHNNIGGKYIRKTPSVSPSNAVETIVDLLYIQ